MNDCGHDHGCIECGQQYKCEHPECASLLGFQRLCARCSYLYGWAQTRDKGQHDSSSLYD